LVAAVARWRVRLQACDPVHDLESFAAIGGRFVVPDDEEWPQPLHDLGIAAPAGMWVRGAGHLARLTAVSVALVGSRAATRYGERSATELATGLASHDVTTVSGAAFGVDAAAHRGALAAGHATVGVLACGADRAYPSAHAVLLDRIAEDGVIASESPPGAAPTRWRFLERNRLIAALAGATVVVEAAWRSGALNTAHHAQGLGRPTAAVPGPVSSAASAGCHRLLRSGAVCVTTAAEIVELLRPIGSFTVSDPFVATSDYDGLDADELRVWETLHPRTWMSVAQLSVAAGLPEAAIRSALGVFTLDARASASYDELGRQLWRRAAVSCR
jgi:DNA processing protein